ncbi:MAG TPA: hypothetical protein VD735_06650 [Candidatus Saccharimonadales bacterium]|nr:hypothetical protein [Candidatus Saccharimonadales bacterium]
MNVLSKFLAVVTASVLTAGALVTTQASAATVNKLQISQNTSGQITIQQGQVLQAGPIVDVQVSSSYATADPEIFQLRNGVTLTQMDQKIMEAGQGGQVAASAMQWFTQNTTFYGGLSAPGSVSFKLIMPAGSYYVAQLNPSPTVKPSTTAKKFSVIGQSQAINPYADQSVQMNDVQTDRFIVNSFNGKLHTGALNIYNKSRELHFTRFVQVKQGTTNAQISAWLAGTGADPTVPGGSVLSFGTLSPQRYAQLNLNVNPGTYVILDFIPDTTTGRPHALDGMFLLTTVN